MVREIGSEFWDVSTCEKQNNVFSESTQWFLSGRSALKAIIKDLRDCRTVAMPSWCCDSMVKPFIDAGIEVHFYPIYWDEVENGLIQETQMDCDVLFLMDYFGYTTDPQDTSGYQGVVIRDITHSIFSATYNDADYYFGSLRKWCGVWTGGYAWAKNGHVFSKGSLDDRGYTYLREKAMQLKNSYINGYVDRTGNTVTDKGYLEMFEDAEDTLEDIGIAPAADRDVELARRLDIDEIKVRRRENAELLRESFSDWLIFPELKDSDCPMFVPILVPDGRRTDLRRHLISIEIYCPIHWPVSEYHTLNKRERMIYDNELSLVCDQRYSKKDMSRMVDAIKAFMEDA